MDFLPLTPATPRSRQKSSGFTHKEQEVCNPPTIFSEQLHSYETHTLPWSSDPRKTSSFVVADATFEPASMQQDGRAQDSQWFWCNNAEGATKYYLLHCLVSRKHKDMPWRNAGAYLGASLKASREQHSEILKNLNSQQSGVYEFSQKRVALVETFCERVIGGGVDCWGVTRMSLAPSTVFVTSKFHGLYSTFVQQKRGRRITISNFHIL